MLVQRTGQPPQQNDLARHVNSAKIEKVCSRATIFLKEEKKNPHPSQSHPPA